MNTSDLNDEEQAVLNELEAVLKKQKLKEGSNAGTLTTI